METAALATSQGKPKATRKAIPEELIYEMRRGKPIYYRDYTKVLTHAKCLDEVKASTFLQGFLAAAIVGMLGSRLNMRQYAVMTNQAGFEFAPKSWRLLDIGIFEKKALKKELLSTKYVKTPPKVVIEVDTKADLKNYGDILSYLTEKTEDLLSSGVEKVIWILTDSRKVVVAEQGQTWLLEKWTDHIPVVDDVSICVEELVNSMTEEE